MRRNNGIPGPRVRTIVLALGLAGFGLAGCSGGHTRVHVVHTSKPTVVVAEPRVVVIERGHRHSHRCGHYCHNGTWYFAKGHVHGKKCGHRKMRGVWVVTD